MGADEVVLLKESAEVLAYRGNCIIAVDDTRGTSCKLLAKTGLKSWQGTQIGGGDRIETVQNAKMG